MGPTKRGKGTKVIAVADTHGLPVAIDIASASPHEITLVEPLLDRGCFADTSTGGAPERLLGDRAYDSDWHDERLAERGIALIAPHRKNRKRPVTQDRRALRRYKRRWQVERLLVWLQNFRRILVRHEYHRDNYLGFLHLGCLLSSYAIYETASKCWRVQNFCRPLTTEAANHPYGPQCLNNIRLVLRVTQLATKIIRLP